MCISSIQFGKIETFWVQSSLWISSHFDTEHFAWRLDIGQNFSCLIFLGHFVPKYILENIYNNLAHKDLI